MADARIPLRVSLHSLGGGAAPSELVADVAGFARLPEPARTSLWDALGPSLPEPPPRDLSERLRRFAEERSASVDDVARVVLGLRFVVRQAAARDLSMAVLAEDLGALTSGVEGLREAVAAGYDAAKRLVRGEVLQRAVLEHGKLLERVTYRVDYLLQSTEAEKLHVPVTMLTLTVRDGDARERLTVQVLPEQLRSLRDLCNKLLA
jgi:hypothetical protein